MRTWVLYKRKNLLGKQETTFGVDIVDGKIDEIRYRFAGKWSGPRYERTIAPGESPSDLAKIVAKDPTIKIDQNDDLIVSLERTIFILGNKYMDIPATPEEVREFYNIYKAITSHDA